MFEVNINGKQYRVAFAYFVDESVDPRDAHYDIDLGRERGATVRYTRANLYLVQDGEKIPVAFADTACSLYDNFVKEVGRKHALTRLMGDGSKHSLDLCGTTSEIDLPDFMDKDVRTAFWQAYFGRQIDDRIRNGSPNPNPWGWPAAILNKNDQEFLARETEWLKTIAGVA